MQGQTRRWSRRGAALTRREKDLDRAEAAAQDAAETGLHPASARVSPRQDDVSRCAAAHAPYAKVSTGRRLALARWIVDRRNPLAARVAVNHIWARHFGEPLVASSPTSDSAHHRPELQELLDWLAVELMESGWSLKHLHRLIVTSRGLSDAILGRRVRTTRTSGSIPTTITSGG